VKETSTVFVTFAAAVASTKSTISFREPPNPKTL
jgi:hypothetical protein